MQLFANATFPTSIKLGRAQGAEAHLENGRATPEVGQPPQASPR